MSLPAALGRFQSWQDVFLGVVDPGRGCEAADQHAVGDRAGESQNLRPAAGDVELRDLGGLPVERTVLEFHHLAIDGDFFSAPQPLHQLGRFAQACDRLGAAVAGQRLEMAARSHDDAEAARRQFRERGGGLRQQGGVPRIGIDHAGAQADRGRTLRGGAQARKHLARPLLVVVKEAVETELLGELDLVQEARAGFGAERCE